MRALSVRQPFANLIACGRKRIELRSWTTDYRGPLVICAGRTVDRDAATRLRLASAELEARGVTICVVELVDVRPFEGTRAGISDSLNVEGSC
jgi:ASCH domain-containing protein